MVVARLVVPLLWCLWSPSGLCFPNGSVTASCGHMLPLHSSFGPSSSPSPYRLWASAATYRPGALITVTLEAENSSGFFQGFLLLTHSSRQTDPVPVGSFQILNSSVFTALSCNNQKRSGVSQADGQRKSRVQVTWEAPDDGNHGDVTFRATVVQSYTQFWVNVSSASVQLERSRGDPSAMLSWVSLVLSSLSLTCCC